METKKKVLIVDDDIDIHVTLKAILTANGYEVFSAYDKNEGIEKLRAVNPNIAILDVMMTSPYEGFELAEHILSSEEFKDVPFLIQSSIDILTTSSIGVQQMAREARKDPNFKDLRVILVKNLVDQTAGIDYMDDRGITHWFQVRDFIRKPIEAGKIIPAIEKHIK